MTPRKIRPRSVCPVASTLDIVGDRWTLLVVRDLLAGKTRFGEFLRSPEKIATNVLTDRLVLLTQLGFVRTMPASDRAGAVEYALTSRGQSLQPVLEAIADWGLAHLPGTERRIIVPAARDDAAASEA